jgi:hypothetical protein
MTDGFDVFVHDVIAAITTWPWSSSVSVPSSSVTGHADLGAIGDLQAAGAAVVRLERPRRGLVVAVVVARGRRIGGRERVGARLVRVRLALLRVLGVIGQQVLEREPERRLGLRQRDTVLRALRAGERRHDLREVELERVGERRLLGVGVVPQALLLRVLLDQLEPLLRPPRELEVAQRLLVDREDRAGRAELRRHVADRRPVGQRQRRHARAEELDEHADHAALAQHLGDGEHEVGGGGALGQLTGQLEAEHLRDQHRHRLAEHRRLGLDAADAPAEHAEAVDHRGVRVGPDERVGIGLLRALVCGLVGREHDAREVLEVDLVDDPGVRRHDREVVEAVLPPAQERVALLVALELALGVDPERVAGAEGVDLHGVVDDQLGGHERVDRRGVALVVGDRVAHGGEVDHGGHAREVLHHHARGGEGDLLDGSADASQRASFSMLSSVTATPSSLRRQVLEQHLQRERQPGDVELGLERVEPEDLEGLAPDLEFRPRAKEFSDMPCSVAGEALSEGASASRRRSAPRPAPSRPPARARRASAAPPGRA